jgi:thiol-disulfide isomerase/thioredoxin
MNKPAAKPRRAGWLIAPGQARRLAAFAIVLAGCGRETNIIPSGSGASARPPSIALRVAGADDYRKTIDKLRGNVVLVDFWATWCAPCIEQFPHTVELHHKYADRGLAVVSVSLNDAEEEPQVREFLTQQNADFENLLSEYGSGVKSIERFGLPGPVPCYRVYDREGKLVREFTVDPRVKKQFTHDDIEAALSALL